MNNLKMLKKAMLAYVSAVKFIWSAIAYPLSIVGKKLMNLRGYKVYGNSIQDGTPAPDSPVEIESVGDLTKNLFDKTKVDSMATIVEGTDDIIVTDSGNIFLNHVNTIAMLKPSTTYTISFDIEVFYVPDDTIWKLNSGGSGGWFGVLLYSSVNNAIRMIASNVKEPVEVGDKYHVYRVFTTPDTLHEEDANYFMYSYGGNYVKIDGTSGYASGKSKFSNFQIREGEYTQTEMDEYEPYNKYKIPVVARGKNLFDGSSSEGNGKYLNSNGVLGSGSDNLRVTDYITIPSGVFSLTFSYNGDVMNYPSICLYNENKKYITGIKYLSRTNVSISVPSNAKYVRCSYRTVNTDIQLEGGSTKTGYEPYIAPVTTNIFLDEPLRKVGDYADYVDFEKQKVVRKIKKRDFDGSEDWKAGTIKETTNVYSLLYGAKDAGSKVCISNRFIDSAEGDVEKIVIGADYLIYIAINKTTAADLATFRTWLANNPTYITYALATPTEETVNLPALPQFKGTTIYEVGTNIKPSGMEAKYC